MTQPRLSRTVGAGAAAALLTIGLASCGMGGSSDQGGGGSSDGGGGDHLVYDTEWTPAAAWALESNDAILLSRAGCLETLLRYEVDGDLAAGLATEWEQKDPKTWSFTLREGVTFQDGTPMTSKEVVGALQHLLDAKTPALAFNPDTIKSVKAADETTVEIATPAVDVLLPYRLSSPSTGILAPKAYAGDKTVIEGTCTGPFTVASETPRQSIDLERNEDYWGEKAELATVQMRFIVDGATRVTQLQTGEAHIIESVPAASRASLEGDDAVTLQTLALPRTTAMLFNDGRAPFDNPEVRRAFQHAIDMQAIADTVYEGAAVPAIGPFSPDDPWAPQDAEPPTFDPDEATKILEDAGVDPADLGFDLIAYNDRPEFADLAAVIQEQLRKIGVTVKIKPGEYASFEPALLEGDFDAVLLARGYLVDLGDPAGFLSSDYTCDGGYNIAHYCDEETDALIKEAAVTEETEARQALYADVAERLQEQAAGVYLVHNTAVSGVRSEVDGYEIHPMNFYGITADLSLD